MSVFTSLGFFILSALIVVSLKLIPGIFALFYHYASGKYSAHKVGDLTIFFIFGVELLPAMLFVIFNLILRIFTFTNLDFNNDIFPLILAGLSLALALSFFLFYFQKGRNTKLFISRKTAGNFIKRAQTVKTRSDAFLLGFTSGMPELIFTLPLYFIFFFEISKSLILPSTCATLFLLFILLIISPLFILYAYFRSGNNLANFERLRIKNKTFFRFFTPSLYILLTALLIIFRVFL